MAEKIPHWLTKQAFLAPNRVAIERVDGSTMTFLELKEQSQLLAKKLASLGVGKGSHVGILSNNNVTMIAMIHALSYLGAVAVLLNARLTASELNYQIKDANVIAVIVEDNLFEQGKELEVEKVFNFKQVHLTGAKEIELLSELDLDDPFTIIYTSGTTGFPKGVIHTFGNHWWSAIGSALNLGISDKDKWLAVLPYFHVGGLSIFIKSVIYGMPVYHLNRFSEDVFLDAIYNRGVTIASVVTVMVQRIMEQLGEKVFPEHFRCMLLGGGPAPVPLLEQAALKKIPVFQSFGMTETSSQIVTLSPRDALRKIGSAGKALFPAQIKIEGTTLNEIGEIFVKGPMVTKGYYNNDLANRDSFHNGWLSTGDLGYIDDEGFLYVVDRRKDLIISGGENIYPSEIESVLTGFPGVKEVGVTGKPDERWGQSPIAFIVPQNDYVRKEDILDYAKDKLAKYKLPKEIHFVNSLPRNASNKLVRNKLMDLIN
ncbi:o-succinylbenzoate--CoA ligase [Ornithinibacillus halotolerans]|uniref:2-succinylbenzoate--CoA ligase n=1 Tax=Ornithinibacillus halotolerans TaxID=1274357 RepID=A0A916W8P0_9BACI|nr:o-succinylbenzoate--CoA ligase [Ornithinibacillus halotolerans]GGA76439.1 2-succinylbenzoate--CoA ligase [Ornithinibacillus halotolerans]